MSYPIGCYPIGDLNVDLQLKTIRLRCESRQLPFLAGPVDEWYGAAVLACYESVPVHFVVLTKLFYFDPRDDAEIEYVSWLIVCQLLQSITLTFNIDESMYSAVLIVNTVLKTPSYSLRAD